MQKEWSFPSQTKLFSQSNITSKIFQKKMEQLGISTYANKKYTMSKIIAGSREMFANLNNKISSGIYSYNDFNANSSLEALLWDGS